MDPSHRTLKVLSGAALLLLVGLVVLVVGHIRALEQDLSVMSERSRVLEREVEAKDAALNVARSDMAHVEAELLELQKPQAVNGPANFPISRVLAQRGDTVAMLARRQGTSPDVIYALNPWLEGASDLIVGQAIWIPNGVE